MPWKEENAVTLREEFVLKSLGKTMNFGQLCREYDVSRKTGYKWLDRFKNGGLPALRDQSRRPHSSPDALPEHVICELIRIKTQSPTTWGPKKILNLYERLHGANGTVSISSVKRVMDKAGFVRRRRRRASPPARIQDRVVPTEPNELWTVDFKGWWKMRDGQRCDPLTLRDGASRFLLELRGMSGCAGADLLPVFEDVFEKYGIPQAIRSDNGSPFASTNGPLGLSQLSCWWVSLGIRLDRIDPGRPDQNGAHERIHRDIRAELQLDPAADIEQSQALFDQWRHCFNWERPNEGIGMKFPGELYKRSEQAYATDPTDIGYSADWLERRVSSHGAIKLSGTRIMLSQSLAGYVIGLQPVADRLDVWFDYLRLGHLDLGTMKFIRIEGKRKRRPPCGRGPARTGGRRACGPTIKRVQKSSEVLPMS